jgi:Flp pilus assembly pilin Flp
MLLLRALAAWHEMCTRLASTRAQTLAEYSLLLTIVAVGVVVPTLILFRGMLAGAFEGVRVCLPSGC